MSRNRSSAESLLLQQRGHLRALAFQLLGDHAAADDVLQDAWLVAAGRGPPRQDNVSGWLRTIVRNLALKHLRGAGRRKAREQVVAAREAVPSASELAARLELEQILIEAVASLGQPYRQVILLRFFEGLMPRTIAAAEGVPVGTIKTRLSRAISQLRVLLDARHGGRTVWQTPLAGLIPWQAAFSQSALRESSTLGATGIAHGTSSALITGSIAMGTKAWLVVAVVVGVTAFFVGRESALPRADLSDGRSGGADDEAAMRSGTGGPALKSRVSGAEERASLRAEVARLEAEASRLRSRPEVEQWAALVYSKQDLRAKILGLRAIEGVDTRWKARIALARQLQEGKQPDEFVGLVLAETDVSLLEELRLLARWGAARVLSESQWDQLYEVAAKSELATKRLAALHALMFGGSDAQHLGSLTQPQCERLRAAIEDEEEPSVLASLLKTVEEGGGHYGVVRLTWLDGLATSSRDQSVRAAAMIAWARRPEVKDKELLRRIRVARDLVERADWAAALKRRLESGPTHFNHKESDRDQLAADLVLAYEAASPETRMVIWKRAPHMIRGGDRHRVFLKRVLAIESDVTVQAAIQQALESFDGK